MGRGVSLGLPCSGFARELSKVLGFKTRIYTKDLTGHKKSGDPYGVSVCARQGGESQAVSI